MQAKDEGQLELFDVGARHASRVERRGTGPFRLTLRYDQFILGGIVGLIVLTVVFACGVERGKQIARSERSLMLHMQEAPASMVKPQDADTALDKQAIVPVSQPASSSSVTKSSEQTRKRVPARSLKKRIRTKLAENNQRYAIQVITYSKPERAMRELEALRARGKEAFLRKQNGLTMVYVGPFVSKSRARAELPKLKGSYGDCFLKTL